MTPKLDKIDDAVLALLHLTSSTEGKGEFAYTRAWKGHDWDAMIACTRRDPKGKAKSVAFTPEGRRKSEELFRQLFCD